MWRTLSGGSARRGPEVERSGRRSTLRSGATVAFTMLLLKLPSYAVFLLASFFNVSRLLANPLLLLLGCSTKLSV